MATPPRLLLAEDNPHDHFFLEEAFTAQDISVTIDCICDGEQMLSRLRTLAEESVSPYSLVVLDAHLPRYAAEEILAQLDLRSRKFETPIVVVSSVLNDQKREQYFELGATEVLPKPMDLSEYLELAQRLHTLFSQGE